MLARQILSGRIEQAKDIVNGPNVTTHPIGDVDGEFVGDNKRLLAHVLNIKKALSGKRKMGNREQGGKVLKLEQPYDRLVLCR